MTFNWVGYRFVSTFLEHQSDITLQANIEQAQYDESDLIELRIPLNTPYLINRSTTFERCYGEVNIAGNDYTYVMRKIENDELVLRCLKNSEKSRIRNSRMDFFKLVNDLNNTGHQKESGHSSAFKSFSPVFQQENHSWDLKPLDINAGICQFAADNTAQLTGFANVPEQPPRI
ncbi:MAG: hypothetical protein JNK79_08010 [Chitinophagaceae bacterium]|nr:hypothetical protein [Chitinophagaceae bacterium]